MLGLKSNKTLLLFLLYLSHFASFHFVDAQVEEVLRIANKPDENLWVNGNRLPSQKLNLISWLVDDCFHYGDGFPPEFPKCDFSKPDLSSVEPPEFQSFDGFYNNIFETSLGAVDTPLLRRVPPVYSDGTYQPVKGHRINPFEASGRLMTRSPDCTNSNNETVACGSKTGKTAFLVYFGQQVVEEVLDAQRPGCPPEYFNIPIPEGHEFRENDPHKSEMPFLRSRYLQTTGYSPGNPRQQLNEITPWLDGGLIYGTAKAWADVLRTFPNGTLHPGGQLASDKDEGLFPAVNKLRLPLANPPPPAHHAHFVEQHETANVDRFFVLGNPRGNENAFLLAFGVVLFRWHNQFATYFHESRPEWSGERVFQEARKWSIATYQQIVIYDWIPEWLGEPLTPYNGYNPSVHPQIEQFFQTAAMRFGHTLVTPGAYMREYQCGECQPIPFYGLGQGQNNPGDNPGLGAVRTCNIYWRPQEPLLMAHEPPECLKDIGDNRNVVDIDRLLMGMASQRAEREDNMIVEDLRGRVFGPLEFSRRDLMAINIQRGRDHGTPDYNTAREAFGLNRITSVEQYVNETDTATPMDILDTMVEIHRTETDEDAWSNIDVWTGGILETSDRPGPLFRAIIKDQFTRIRDADRFWFENQKWKKPRFTPEQISRIKTLKVYDMILSVTRMKEGDIQANPFQVPDENFIKNCGNETLWEKSECKKTERDANGEFIREIISDCYHFPQLHSEVTPVENCTTLGSFDYFDGSQISFILTFCVIGILVIGINLLLKLIAVRNQKDKSPNQEERAETRITARFSSLGISGVPVAAREWEGHKEGTRPVALVFIGKTIEVRSHHGDLLREIRLELHKDIDLILVTDDKHLVMKLPSDYDLALQFDGSFFRNAFLRTLRDALGGSPLLKETTMTNLKMALKQVATKKERISHLEKFFRLVFLAPSEIGSGNNENHLEHEKFDEVRQMELSLIEFAEALGMNPSNHFVQNVFNLVDVDKNGRVSFQEFFCMLVLFKDGTAEDKAQYLFNIYDTDRNGLLTQDEFPRMLQSMMEASLPGISQPEMAELTTSMMSTLGLGPQAEISLPEFQRLFASHKDTLGHAQLNFKGVNAPGANNKAGPSRTMSFIQNTRHTMSNLYDMDGLDVSGSPLPADHDILVATTTENSGKHWLLTWFEVNRLSIFWLTMYVSIALAIFAERAYYYTVEREHGGLRHIAGFGVTITRGAASVQMFCYASLLLTMCRNTITFLRETFLRRFIPFDSNISFHKFIACFALFFTAIHVVGHGVNFYHISTQTPEDLSCLFRAYFRPTHKLPKFTYWVFQTVTGMSGILLVLLAAVIYTFATNYARTHVFKAFWITHHTYPVFYALILLHGSGNLVQEPLFFNFLVAPLFLFIFDKILAFSRRSVELPVLKAELLPSKVTMLKFARPIGFQFKSGQWIRIACTALNPTEFHPFTISSAPHEPHLTVHIRAVGPFTNNIRQVYESVERPMPKLILDGPYGEGHQDWHRYEVSVLIGGGIGVTPFASILKDIAAQSAPTFCKKVYFVWVTRTQKQFEWLVDIIRNVEGHKTISVHLFITQANSQFDLRTVLLYVCERTFEKMNKRSLFTGLKSTTHFGRPNFNSLFRSLREKHSNVSKFGIFTCGSQPLSESVNDACHEVNGTSGSDPHNEFEFQHHFENF